MFRCFAAPGLALKQSPECTRTSSTGATYSFITPVNPLHMSVNRVQKRHISCSKEVAEDVLLQINVKQTEDIKRLGVRFGSCVMKLFRPQLN